MRSPGFSFSDGTRPMRGRKMVCEHRAMYRESVSRETASGAGREGGKEKES